MPAGKEGVAPESALPWAGMGHRQEWATWARGKRDAGLRRGGSPGQGVTAGSRRWLRGAAGRALVACDEGAAPESARPWAGMDHGQQREEGCRRRGGSPSKGVTGGSRRWLRRAAGRALAACDEGAVPARGRNWRGGEAGRGMPAGKEGVAPRQGATVGKNGPSLGKGRGLPAREQAAAAARARNLPSQAMASCAGG